ncbi:Uncharacterised protein [Escherichia coli]|nr:Uncharacterised protein [Escherichia coli]
MAGGKKDDNAAGFVLILVCVILWGIYVAVRALINLNERFIDAVSNPAGIIGLFFWFAYCICNFTSFFYLPETQKENSSL